jgi:YebC/PmpR family DNA-binding regulatory protein
LRADSATRFECVAGYLRKIEMAEQRPRFTKRAFMSGHSKWATIKHKKAATDAKRGRVFTRIIREITIAARIGGGDPNSNPRLRTAILAAKNENMPNENIERGILRGTGQLEGEVYEEATFEGYGPGGVGMLIQVVSTNRNRIVGEFRHLMSKNGGTMAEAGAVGWMFSRKGEITVPKEAASEDKLLDIVLEAGAEDMKYDGGNCERSAGKGGNYPSLRGDRNGAPELHQAYRCSGNADAAAGGSLGRA